MLEPYPPEVRERAVQLVLEEGKSYAEAGEIAAKEHGLARVSKSTVYNWVKAYKKKHKKEEEPEPESKPEPESENEVEVPKPEEPKDKAVEKQIEEVKKDLNIDVKPITPQEIVEQVQGSISTVEDGILIKEPSAPVEETAEEKKGILDRIREPLAASNHIFIYAAVLIGISLLITIIYKLWSRRKEKEEIESLKSKPEPEEPKPARDDSKRYKGVPVAELP